VKDQLGEVSATPPGYHRARLERTLIRLRRRARALCDLIGLGPSTGERVACAFIKARMEWLKGQRVSWAFGVDKVSDLGISFRPARREGPGKAATVIESLLSRPGSAGLSGSAGASVGAQPVQSTQYSSAPSKGK
jgi:hypothetical protein